MAIQTQLRRGTTAENDAFTGAIGELVYDTQKKQLRMQDGTTVGGIKVPLIGDFESTGITDDATATVLTLTAANNADFSGDISLVDGKHLYLGTDNDLDVIHDGAKAVITNDTGLFLLLNTENSQILRFSAANSVGGILTCAEMGGATPDVKLYYDGLEVMKTVSGGINLGDNKALYLGADNDIQIKHTGAVGSIVNSVGSFYIVQAADGADFIFDTHDSGGVNKTNMRLGGAVPYCRFYGDGVVTFSTKASSVYKTINFSSIPTSTTGLSAGDVWSNGGVLTIV